jgi:lysophospholipase L1-like esterase
VKSLLVTSLIAYWPLGEKVGAVNANDVSGYARNGVFAGTPILASTGIGDGETSADFNAAGEINAYSAGLASAFNPNAGMFAWWSAANDAAIYADANQYNYCYFGPSATYYYQGRKNGASIISFLSRRSATVKTASVDVPTTTRWLHLAMVWDTSGDQLIAYVNGAKQRPVTALGTWVGSLANLYTEIGDIAPGVGNVPWPGRMAHCALTNAIPANATINSLALQEGQIIFDGDSRSLSKLWPSAAVELAFPSGLFAYGKRGVSSWAVSGGSSASALAQVSTITGLFGSGKNTVVVWCGVNEGATLTAAQIYANLKAYCQAITAAGGKAILCSEIDSQANMSWHNTVWPALNALINADHSFVDGYVNLGADARLQNALDTTYFNADKIHLTATGYNVVRDLVYPVIGTVAA